MAHEAVATPLRSGLVGSSQPSTTPSGRRWWVRSVAAFPTYASYAEKTDRLIPVLVASPA
ncbi:MAG: nitroreductase/quinone reductase family protein [Actinomycetales bacterium]|nr:nitroreductase/quinone reductase family protein [Actinomycetales bacterium]